MAKAQSDVDLLPYNTFKVSVKAKYFLAVNSPEDIPNERALILGDGANVLFTKDYDGLVIKNNLLGKKEIEEGVFEIGSGENWIDLVNWSVNGGWSGIENLAYIPGTVGAAPVQNIAAYGQSFEDIFVSLSAINLKTGEKEIFTKTECLFGYRESIFKKSDFFVTTVTISLSKTPRFVTDYYSRYESLAAVLPKSNLTPKIITEAVTSLRKSKLPDWTKLGTAGSFFKNPNVSWQKYQELSGKISNLQHYPANKLSYSENKDEIVKIPAGRLLDELGWKGKRIGNVGTFENHALTVINFGDATGQEILDFSLQMQADVKKNFGIELEPEVNII